jgi:hypothetical protein
MRKKIHHEKFIELYYQKKWTAKQVAKYFGVKEASIFTYRRDKKLPVRGNTFHPFKGKKHTLKSRKKMSNSLKGKFAKENNYNWKGGRYLSNGRWVIRVEDNHPYAYRGYIKRARYVMEQHLGRYLKPEEYVHHINGDKQDDRIENLQLTDMVSHAKHHFPKGSKFGINSNPR